MDWQGNCLRRGFIVMLSTLLAACSAVGLKVVNTPSYLFSNHHVTRDISYGNAPHQLLDLYVPQADIENKGQLVVFIYGGSWTSGAKENYYFVADALTSAGYTVAIPDYIKFPAAAFPSFVEDVALSIAWLSSNMQGFAATNEMILMGHSAGAHTGALLISDPTYLAAHQLQIDSVSAFIGIAGPYSFIPKEKKFRDIFANLEDFQEMQALHYVQGLEPPMLLLHGDEDTTVLLRNSEEFAAKVNTMGGTAETQVYSGQGHVSPVLGLSRIFDRDNSVRTDILEFLQRVTL